MVMVDGTATLVIDLGNSDTRVLTEFGVNGKGKVRRKLSVLSNRYGILPEDKIDVYLTNQIYSEEDSSIFKLEGDHWCNGDICLTELTSTTQRPSALHKKYNSLPSKLSIMNGLKRGYEDVAEFADCDLTSVNVSWDLVLLLPPEDVDEGAKQIAELARTIDSIEFLMPELKKNISINSINVYPEGFCAYIAVVFESKKKIRKSHAYLVEPTETTLIADIGAGTTDFTVAKGGKIITSTRFTRAIGGNNVHRRVGKLLRERGISLPENFIREGTETGFVRSGSKEYDIKEEIATAKRDVSKQLVDAVEEFFENNMIPIQSINNLLLCGGGAMESDVEGIEPIADYITDFITSISPDIRRVELPEDEDGEKLSPRLLNVIGAGILSE